MKEGEQTKREILVRMNGDAVTGPKTEIVIGIFSDKNLIEEQEIQFSGPGF